MFQLSLRLASIAEQAKGSMIVADIGTDHAYLPIYLIHHQFCQYAIACDVEDVPIQQAKLHVAKYRLCNNIIIRQGDGLTPLHIEEIETVVIAGMGGHRIIKILDKELLKAKQAKKLILQPMRNHLQLTQWLVEQGFVVDAEWSIQEKKQQYHVIQTYFPSV